jgi:HAD superfamily hydrolase (TIGR01509 family)
VAFDGFSPRAVVFDCDGLLVDTEPCSTVAETVLFARRGLPFGEAEKRLLIGRSILAAGEHLSAVFDEPGQGSEIAVELEALILEVIGTEARAQPGAHRVVELAAARVPVAVASNSSRALLEVALRRGGFEGRFAVSVAGDEIDNPKPAPDMYHYAASLLGAEPAECLAFEDSMTGVRSALSAGLRLVCVPSMTMPDPEGAWVVSTLDDSRLQAWIGTWQTVL